MSILNSFQKYIEDVCRSVTEKSVHSEIAQELSDHMNEVYEENLQNGCSQIIAEQRTLKTMGEASVVGERLNRSYRPNNICFLLLCIQVSFCFVLILYDVVIENSFPYQPGLLSVTTSTISWKTTILNMIITSIGVYGLSQIKYGLYLKHINKLFVFYSLTFLFSITLLFFARIDQASIAYILSSICLICFSILLYRTSYHNKNILAPLLFLTLSTIVISWCFENLISIFSLLVSSTVICIVAIHKEWIKPAKKINMLILGISIVLCLLTLLTTSKNIRKELTILFLPQVDASSYMSPGYDNMLVRTLIRKTNLISPAEFKNEEFASLIDRKYGYSDGVYSDLDASKPIYHKWKSEHLRNRNNAENCFIEYVLPSNYATDYLFLYSALKLGILPTLLIIIVVFLGPIYLLRSSLKLKGKLSAIIAIPCAVTVLTYLIFYLFGNIGFRPKLMGGLPLISTGKSYFISIVFLLTANFSCLKFDNIIREDYFQVPSMLKRRS